MSAGIYNLSIEQGATFDLEIRYKDANGDPVDLTGYNGRLQIRQTTDTTIPYITLSSSLQPDGTGLNFSGSDNNKPPTSGSISIFISAYSSSLLNFGQAVYDLEIYSGSYAYRLIQGGVRLSKEVTRY